MIRGKLIPSLNYRSKGVIDFSVPSAVVKTLHTIEVYGASNIDDAFDAPRLMFSVRAGKTFVSPTLSASKYKPQEDTKRDSTRVIFSLDDYATVPALGETKIPSEGDVVYLRLRGLLEDGVTRTDFGPITSVPPYDFLSVSIPVFTCIATAPNLNLAAPPDTLGQGALNLCLLNYSQTINLKNLNVAGSLYFSFAPGMSPSILRAGEEIGLTGVTAPDLYVAGENQDVTFTLRCGIVNKG